MVEYGSSYEVNVQRMRALRINYRLNDTDISLTLYLCRPVYVSVGNALSDKLLAVD